MHRKRFHLTFNFLGYILAPLAVHPEFQKRRIGADLITSSCTSSY